MKANELMIGDWVMFQGREIVCGNQIFSSEYDGCIIEPIPLTPEILEKNGWKCKTTEISTDVRGEIVKDVWFMMQLLDGYGHWNMRLSKVGAGETFDLFIQIHYVHQLQHALRLCGLAELADNFKI